MVLAAIVLGLSSCTGSASIGTSSAALPSSAGAGARICGVVAEQSVQIATGEQKLFASGDPVVDQNGLSTLNCTVSSPAGEVFGATVLPLGARPDLEKQARADASEARGDVFARSVGIGSAQAYPMTSDTKAGADLIVGGFLVNVGLQRTGQGRNRLKDVVALTLQVVNGLHLQATGSPPPSAPRS